MAVGDRFSLTRLQDGKDSGFIHSVRFMCNKAMLCRKTAKGLIMAKCKWLVMSHLPAESPLTLTTHQI